MRFVAASAGPAWRGAEALAATCESAQLFADQAEIVRLAGSGLTLRAVATQLSALLKRPLPAEEARTWILAVERRVRRSRPDLVALQRQHCRELLAAMRNVRPCRPQLQVYRQHWWGCEAEPLRLRSRLDGEIADDLMRQPLRFLRDLPYLLAETGG